MKLFRLSMLLLVLGMSVLVVPDAFGGKGGGGSMQKGGGDSRNAEACLFYVYCYYTPDYAYCYGSASDCCSFCESLCGGPCDCDPCGAQ